jgi:hypothetical protein
MKVYNNAREIERDIIDGTLLIDNDVMFNFKELDCDINIEISGDLICFNLSIHSLKVGGDIHAHNIICNFGISGRNIYANRLESYFSDISCNYLSAYRVVCESIYAHEIKVNKLCYEDICYVYGNISCLEWDCAYGRAPISEMNMLDI